MQLQSQLPMIDCHLHSDLHAEMSIWALSIQIDRLAVLHRYEKKGGPAARLTKRIGSTYTASVFVNLYSLLCSIPQNEMKGKRISVFSYGSGSASTMYHLEAKGEVKLDRTIFDRLSTRQKITVR